MDGTILNKKLKIEEKLAQLNEIAQKVDDMPTFTSNDRAFLEELPGFPVTDGKKVLTATTESGETSLTYEEAEGAEYTAGDYIVIDNNKISVSTIKQGTLDLYSYEFVTVDASHTPKVKVIKKVNGETVSETVYDEFQAASWMIFDGIIRFRYDASDSYKWKYQCLVTSNEHIKDTIISWLWNDTVDYTETFNVGASAITDLATKGDLNEIKNAIINANDFAAAQAALAALNSVRVAEVVETPVKKTRSKK